MNNLKPAKRVDVIKENYHNSKGWLIDLDINAPTAIGSLEAAYSLKEKVPVLAIVKPGFVIADCLYKDSNDFKNMAKAAGMEVYNAPLGMLHLISDDLERKVGLGDGNFVQLQEIDNEFWDSVRGQQICNKLDAIQRKTVVNEAIYELIARLWNGQNSSTVVSAIANNAMKGGYEKEIESVLKEAVGGLQDRSMYDIAVNIYNGERGHLTEKGNQLLNDVRDYWDYLPRNIRQHCKTEHVKDRLLEHKDRFPITAKNLAGKFEIPEAVAEKVKPMLKEFYEVMMRENNNIEREDDASLRKSIGSTDITKYIGVKPQQMLWGHINRAKSQLRRSNFSLDAGEKKVEQKDITRLNSFTPLAQAADRAIEYVLSFNNENILPTLLVYERDGYVRLKGDVHRIPPPNLDVIMVEKGPRFDELQHISQVCPLGLAKKWDTWKFFYDPVISIAAKYYRNENSLVRVEFDTLGKFIIEPNNGVLTLKRADAEDLIQKIEDFLPKYNGMSRWMKVNRWSEVKANPVNDTVTIEYKPVHNSVGSSLYHPLKYALKKLKESNYAFEKGELCKSASPTAQAG
jgi:hypothetical protein